MGGVARKVFMISVVLMLVSCVALSIAIDNAGKAAEGVSSVDSDDRIPIKISASALTVNISTNRTCLGGSFEVNGTATGTNHVDIITIAPKGGSGRGLYENSYPGVPGITNESIPVENNWFTKVIEVFEHTYPGIYLIWVSIPGRDGYYGLSDAKNASELIKFIIDDYHGGNVSKLRGRTQDQILDILMDATIYKAGSDDLVFCNEIIVEGSYYIRLSPIKDVVVGEPLNVSGTTNREPGTKITITVEGPVELSTTIVEVYWPTPDEGMFNATIDTSSAIPGSYTVTAYDEYYGRMDNMIVNILAAIPTPTPTPTPAPTPTLTPQAKSEIHVHKEEYLSTYATLIDHDRLYNFTTEWNANVWEVENLDNVTYMITTSKNFTYINNWERYQNGTENTFILPPTVEGENYTWVLPLKDRIGSNINFVLDSSQTTQDNPWVDIDVNTTKEDGYERVNVTFTPVIPLNWINLYVRGDQIMDVSAYPPEFEIEMLTSSYVEFDSGDINQGYVYNFSVLVDNPYEVELELYASFGWEVESPSNLITLPVAELGSVTVEADVPVIWEHKPTLPESVQSITIEFEEEKQVYNFDTGSPANPYPSIFGMHNGTITPNKTIIATKLYIYSCAGTGGHAKYARIWNETWSATASWKGYVEDWHNITFDKEVVLIANKTYNFTIITGSYPQIHHTSALLTENGWINCSEFIDANGKEYKDWIPAIKLWS